MANLLYVEDHPPAQVLMQAIIDEMTTHHLRSSDIDVVASDTFLSMYCFKDAEHSGKSRSFKLRSRASIRNSC